MFSAGGVGIIPKDEKIEERHYAIGLYFSFPMVTKDPYKEGSRQWIRVSVQVPKDYVTDARKVLTPGRTLWVRLGEIRGNRSPKGTVYMTVNTKWKWIEPIAGTPGPERKAYEDV